MLDPIINIFLNIMIWISQAIQSIGIEQSFGWTIILFTILIEAFRPLAVLKWVMIPLILILLMIYRPQGLFGFREINISLGGIQDETTGKEATDDTAAD